jgi:oxygen-independent coproporphyrinogen III oxidase
LGYNETHTMKETAIYIHIPFCEHKCIYCDFYSITTRENARSYLDCLTKEIDFYSEQHSSGRKIISIFFGGGTPSLMEPEYIQRIIEHVKDRFDVCEKAEITLETNPGTVTKEKIKYFKNAGVNRISIGIQSFNDDELKFLTRIHNSQTAIKTVYDAAESGFENISLDLIFNLPKQTKEKWLNNLKIAAGLPVKHISAYSLILERGTILNKMVLDGKIKIQDDDYDAELYENTIEFLTARDFNQYEVSNFAVPGFESIHNKAYWQYKDYFGFGSSAHSFIDGKRWWNISSVKFYNESVDKNKNGLAGFEILTKQQMLNEYVMLALRSSGLNTNQLEQKFGGDWMIKNSQMMKKFMDDGYFQKDNKCIKLTPKGYALCDEILQKFI